MRLTALILVIGFFVAWQAVAERGDAGDEAAQRGDFSDALNLWLPRAEAGDLHAQKSVAAIYRFGRNGAPLDPAAAAVWSHRAAVQGDIESMRLVADAYLAGRGFPADISLAEEWYLRAARAGDIIAKLVLGEIYLERANGQRDPGAALAWLTRAAERGNGPARYRLGDLHVAGDYVPRDLIRARMWYILAAGTGKSVAGDEHNDDFLRHSLTDDEHFTARRLAYAWARTHAD